MTVRSRGGLDYEKLLGGRGRIERYEAALTCMVRGEYTEKSNRARIIRQSGGKDRHSKVLTWRGARDRRVRLSVATAIRFYDLQDRLGFDQPSRALDWLLLHCQSSIKALPELRGESVSAPHGVQVTSSSPLSASASADVTQNLHSDPYEPETLHAYEYYKHYQHDRKPVEPSSSQQNKEKTRSSSRSDRLIPPYLHKNHEIIHEDREKHHDSLPLPELPFGSNPRDTQASSASPILEPHALEDRCCQVYYTNAVETSQLMPVSAARELTSPVLEINSYEQFFTPGALPTSKRRRIEDESACNGISSHQAAKASLSNPNYSPSTPNDTLALQNRSVLGNFQIGQASVNPATIETSCPAITELSSVISYGVHPRQYLFCSRKTYQAMNKSIPVDETSAFKNSPESKPNAAINMRVDLPSFQGNTEIGTQDLQRQNPSYGGAYPSPTAQGLNGTEAQAIEKINSTTYVFDNTRLVLPNESDNSTSQRLTMYDNQQLHMMAIQQANQTSCRPGCEWTFNNIYH
ncbi:hypothetical protein KP509_25G064100 [Ceratopteris richardii]|uniref:TCP domain-containing protein n=1 Tax=Ceratopteris richardii TaxID=49495 RepID=A0A8T2RT25_CERRI|nr:hypothetical protein KP509_25G064100 [Ceratopteris richardii]